MKANCTSSRGRFAGATEISGNALDCAAGGPYYGNQILNILEPIRSKDMLLEDNGTVLIWTLIPEAPSGNLTPVRSRTQSLAYALPNCYEFTIGGDCTTRDFRRYATACCSGTA